MKSQLKTTFHQLSKLLQNLAIWMMESTESVLDSALANLAGKDHSLKARFAPEESILSGRYKGFNLTGKNITPELSRMGVLINGGSGSGKSSVSCIRSILTVQGSQIIHDPSGELFFKTSGFLESQGYHIIRLDWSDARHSHRFNPLKRVNTLSGYNKLASQLVGLSSDKKDGFWNAMAIQLLVCIIRIVKQLPEEYQTLSEVAHIIDLLQSKSGQEEVDRLVATVSEKDEGLFEKYASLLSNSENTLSGILASATTAIQMYALDENIIHITATDTLGDFSQWRKQKTVVYLHSSTVNMRYYASLSSIFLQQYFEVLFKELPKKEELDMYFHLDETPILTIELDVLAANVRKYRGSLMVICQDAEAQLTATFGREKARGILSNLKTKLYLSTSLDTANQLQRELGSYEYTDKKSGQTKRRELRTADEIMSLPPNQGIITVAGRRPILAKLTPYYKVPELRKKTKLPPASGSGMSPEGEDANPRLLNISRYLDSLNSPIPNTTTDEKN